MPKPNERKNRGASRGKNPNMQRYPKGTCNEPFKANQFKKGQVTNPNGRNVAGPGTYQRSAREYLNDIKDFTRTELETLRDNRHEPELKRAMADSLLQMKKDGLTIIDIIEQLDGKASQAVNMNVSGKVEVVKRLVIGSDPFIQQSAGDETV